MPIPHRVNISDATLPTPPHSYDQNGLLADRSIVFYHSHPTHQRKTEKKERDKIEKKKKKKKWEKKKERKRRE